MEMKAREDVRKGQDLTPPVAPLSAALYDTSLSSHCSSCFRRHINPVTATSTFVSYCSSRCAAVDSPLHFSSAENNLFLLLLNNNYYQASLYGGDSSDLRASLRFLRLLELLSLLPSCTPPIPARIAGFMTNREKLARHEDAEDWARIRGGARLMATARALRDGRDFDGGDCEVEEAVLCLVLTNAVDVQVSGGDYGVGLGMGVGVAVYDHRFSWINHSCSPNSCYRFLLFSDDLEASENDMLRIVPSTDQMQVDYYGVSFQHMQNFQRNLGPRMILRSIKMIKRGEAVTVTYIDLLQPKMLRQSELWNKYKFLCACRQCIAMPPSYIDEALQETFSCNLHLLTSSSCSRQEAVEKLRDLFENMTSAFMLTNDYVTCCVKIENVLNYGLVCEDSNPNKGSSLLNFRLSPLHHLSLNACTALSSAYRIRALQLIDRSEFQAFKSQRICAGYCLLLAGSVHHLFRSEPSLIVSAATFWTNAGESLVSVAQSSVWHSSMKWQALNRVSTLANGCLNCSLMDACEVCTSCCGAQQEEFYEKYQKILSCISGISSKLWIFLVQDCHYLKDIKDPINFDWLGSLRKLNVWQYNSRPKDCELCSNKENEGTEESDDEETRMVVFHLGAHCLVYGGILSGICYGPNSSRTEYMRNLMRD